MKTPRLEKRKASTRLETRCTLVYYKPCARELHSYWPANMLHAITELGTGNFLWIGGKPVVSGGGLQKFLSVRGGGLFQKLKAEEVFYK